MSLSQYLHETLAQQLFTQSEPRRGGACPERPPKGRESKGCPHPPSRATLGTQVEGARDYLFKWSTLLFLLAVVGFTPRSEGQITVSADFVKGVHTEGDTHSLPGGPYCSLQEAIYATEFGQNVALDATDDDDTYYSGCSDNSGSWNVIDLPGGTLTFTKFWDGDSHNPFGPTATPIIFKAITIRGHGTTLQWAWTAASHATGNFRLFAVGEATIPYSGQPLRGVIGGSYSGIGNLTLQDVYIKGFNVKGGDGGDGGAGGGGGLGAGGAIYIGKVSSGVPSLTVVNSTFDSNSAVGGNGGKVNNALSGGGGGGLGGNGGLAQDSAGGGGGGSRGDGGAAIGSFPGGGGGTVFAGGNGFCDGSDNCSAGAGGYLWGGDGAGANTDGNGAPGQNPGGGGGGGRPAGPPPSPLMEMEVRARTEGEEEEERAADTTEVSGEEPGEDIGATPVMEILVVAEAVKVAAGMRARAALLADTAIPWEIPSPLALEEAEVRWEEQSSTTAGRLRFRTALSLRMQYCVG